MPPLIEQEAPAHTHEAPAQTPATTDHVREATLLQSLEAMMDRLAYLERQAMLLAVQMDLEVDQAVAARLATRPVTVSPDGDDL